jgi:hypothetical protein
VFVEIPTSGKAEFLFKIRRLDHVIDFFTFSNEILAGNSQNFLRQSYDHSQGEGALSISGSTEMP